MSGKAGHQETLRLFRGSLKVMGRGLLHNRERGVECLLGRRVASGLDRRLKPLLLLRGKLYGQQSAPPSSTVPDAGLPVTLLPLR
jgi:hypothetical protein